MRHEQFEISPVIATLLVEVEQLFVGESITDSELPDFSPINRVLGLIFIRDLQLKSSKLKTAREAMVKLLTHLREDTLPNERGSHGARDIDEL